MQLDRFAQLTPFDDETGYLNAIIETPKGCRNKFCYEPKRGYFVLKKIIPSGFAFPFDFGFIPGTLADDDDPLDVLVLMDEPAFPGCIVPSRLVGALKAQQTGKNGETVRNDRLIAVALESPEYAELKSLKKAPRTLTDNLAHFFRAYHDLYSEEVEILDCCGPARAKRLVRKAQTDA